MYLNMFFPVFRGLFGNSGLFGNKRYRILPPVENVGSKKLLPANSFMKFISWKNKLIFTEIILLFIRQNAIPYGLRHYQCL